MLYYFMQQRETFEGENFREFRGFVAIHESFLRENLISAKSRKFSPSKVSHHTVLLYAIPHVTKREMDSGWNSGYYAAILSGKNIAVNGA